MKRAMVCAVALMMLVGAAWRGAAALAVGCEERAGRRAQATAALRLRRCPKILKRVTFIRDAKHSVIDEKREAAYKAAQAPFDEVMVGTAKAADTFRATGSKSAAECVLQLLAANAAADAMTGKMSTNQANYVQNWTLGALAVSWLKVRGAAPGTPEAAQGCDGVAG